ncbi:STAS-like domain-containing protein [Chloroflexota bacterium]
MKEGLIIPEGRAKSKKYSLKRIEDLIVPVDLKDLEEHQVWMKHFDSYFKHFNENIYDICNYGLTEMLNNAIDHSETREGFVGFTHFPNKIELCVNDNGIGIFNKISKELHLSDNREAILELSKGKFTTDPDNHTGEGIFFSSRVFDEFSILSGNLFFIHHYEKDDWLLEEEEEETKGTYVTMQIKLNVDRTTTDIFNKYSGEEYDYSFRRTHVPLSLARYGTEKLVSRSQAKRILSRFERFDEVMLDFSGIDFIGQAFADEIFRVYKSKHPNVNIISVEANERIRSLINSIISNSKS